jgi:hypothetical protein
VRKGEVDFGINMNFITYPDIEFSPLVNELSCWLADRIIRWPEKIS